MASKARFVWDGSKLEKLRKKHELSQSQLCKELFRDFEVSIYDRTVGNWEKGATRPDADQLGMLAAFFSIPGPKLVCTFYRRAK